MALVGSHLSILKCTMANKTKIKLNLIFLAIFTAILAVFIFNVDYARAASIDEGELVNLVNLERKSRGLNLLEVNPLLYLAAKDKGQDMLSKDYFEHYAPYGKSPWDFIHETGYQYQMAGENLAIDFNTSKNAHEAWMNSSSHRDNILKKDYEEVGIATATGDFEGRQTTVIVEMFGKPVSKNILAIDKVFTKIQTFLLGINF